MGKRTQAPKSVESGREFVVFVMMVMIVMSLMQRFIFFSSGSQIVLHQWQLSPGIMMMMIIVMVTMTMVVMMMMHTIHMLYILDPPRSFCIDDILSHKTAALQRGGPPSMQGNGDGDDGLVEDVPRGICIRGNCADRPTD